ncbi:MAG: pitrilysin family protein [Spirochaetia bacterium]
MKSRRMLLGMILVALLPLMGAAGQARDVTGLQNYVLDNGMEVFILENHTVPLARIQITFRTGSISQTPQTAGLFHLYEHMLFKGNKAYPTQTALQAAMKDLGVADWNGGTSQEDVSYYFTVPSDRMEKGIEFWADAVRYPLLDAGELATEKDVVVSEILGYLSDPANIYGSAVDKAMFWKYPWRKDVSGSESLVRSATPQIMRDIRDTWYVPNNAALFVGGDVDPKAVQAAVQRSFGDWKKAKDPWASPPPPHPTPQKDAFLVFPDEQMYEGIVAVDLQFRGPDVTRNPESTYAADVLLKLLDDPNGKFKSDIFGKVPGLYKKEYIEAQYPTQRDGGVLTLSTYMLLAPRQDTFARIAALKKAFTDEMAAIASDPGYFSQSSYTVLKRQILDERVWERETVDGFIGALSFWWSAASTAYYLGYNDALQRVTQPDIAKLISDYVSSRTSVLSVQMNPKDFEKEKASAAQQRWTVITKDNAYWWADQGKGGSQ